MPCFIKAWSQHGSNSCKKVGTKRLTFLFDAPLASVVNVSPADDIVTVVKPSTKNPESEPCRRRKSFPVVLRRSLTTCRHIHRLSLNVW